MYSHKKNAIRMKNEILNVLMKHSRWYQATTVALFKLKHPGLRSFYQRVTEMLLVAKLGGGGFVTDSLLDDTNILQLLFTAG